MNDEGTSTTTKKVTVEEMSRKEIKGHILRLTAGVIDEKGDPNTAGKVQLHAPVVQMYAAELSARFAKNTTIVALFVSALSLIVSAIALYVSYQSAAANIPV
jgi:hypothetical protein